MFLKQLLQVSATTWIAVSALGQPPRTSPETYLDKTRQVLTVCQALERRLELDGRIITIRGHLVGTLEGAWLDSSACDGVAKTDYHVWPVLISLESRSTALPIHPIDFEEDTSSRIRAEQKYLQMKLRIPERCIEITYTGQFATKREFDRQVYTNSPPRFLGFGHGSEAPAQLVIKTTDDVAAIPGCR